MTRNESSGTCADRKNAKCRGVTCGARGDGDFLFGNPHVLWNVETNHIHRLRPLIAPGTVCSRCIPCQGN